jgi:predicted DNA-binding transcriptional regulator YafY
MRNRQFIRQWKILARLSEARLGATYADLMEALEPDDSAALRTIQRDLEALQYAGFQLRSEQEGKQVRWFLSARASMPLPLEAGELVALYSASLSARLGQLPGSDGLQSFCGKLFAGLNEPMRRFLDNVQSAILVLGPRHATVPLRPGDIDRRLAEAITSRKTVEILYQAVGKRRTRRLIDPHALLTAPPNLYVWAWCHERSGMRTFNLQRIWGLRVTETSFTARGVSAAEAFEGSFEIWQGKPQAVRIRFTGAAAVLASERQWHRSQRVVWGDGSVELAMNVFPGADLLRWILGFGAEAEVLQPLSLRHAAAEHVSTAALLYGVEPAAFRPASRIESLSLEAAVPALRSRG